jgi:hypothetical protein
MGRRWAIALLVGLPAALGASPPGPALAGDPPAGSRSAAQRKKEEEALRGKVREAIGRGVAWLRKQQDSNGHFRGANGETDEKDSEVQKMVAGHRVGETALALHALRACGAPAGDPQVAAGFAFIREGYRTQKKVDALQTYDVSFMVIAIDTNLHRAPDPDPAGRKPAAPARKGPPPVDDLPWLLEMTAWLVAAQGKAGGFGYTSPGFYDTDVSNTQIALLALKSARRCAADVPADLWRKALVHLLDAQESAGPPCVRRDESWKPDEGDARRTVGGRDRARGWGYKPKFPGTGSMTAGGVSSLVICRSELLGTPGYDGKLDARAEQGIWDGIAWLGSRFTVSENPGPRDAPAPVQGKQYYYLYGLERAGVLSGIPWTGEHDWYREGATWLIDHQEPPGHWAGGLVETCFALLFLERATPPAPRGAVSGSADEGIDLSGAEGLDEAAFGDLFEAVLRRFTAADAAGRKERSADFVRMGIRSIPRLLRCLKGEADGPRAAAADALLRTTGESRGFDPAAPADARAAAVARWEEWWNRSRGNLVADVGAGQFRVEGR